jgi:uncharacterized protein (DUF1501 family)
MTNRNVTRRRFLGGTLAGLGATAGLGVGGIQQLLAGAPSSDRAWIFCYFGGGWDPLLTLDPRDPTVFTAANVADTRILPGYDQLQDPDNDGMLRQVSADITYGPYIGDLEAHWQDLAVVRGMSMETLGHTGGRRRFITGKSVSGASVRGSSAGTALASLFGATNKIPQLSVGVESFNLDQAAYATALSVNSVPDLLAALRPDATDLGDLEKRQIDQLLAEVAECPDPQRSELWQRAEAARSGVEELVAAGLDSRFDFSGDGPGMAELREHYGIADGNAGVRSAEALGALAVTAVAEGVCRVASIRVANGLDTHGANWATDQGPRQQRGLNIVARMMEDLRSREYADTGESWFDHTTIVCFSEFSRTAMINAQGGRDHSLTNSCLLAGAGIRGGQVIGRSSDVGLRPFPTNLETGLPDEGGELIHPEHIHRALMADAGVEEDVLDLRVEPLNALLG